MTFWIVRDSGIDERISRLWMLLIMRFFILYFIELALVLMLALTLALAMLVFVFTQPTALAIVPIVLSFVLMLAPPDEATVKDAEVPSAPEASDTGAEIVTESAEAPKVLGADEVKQSIR